MNNKAIIRSPIIWLLLLPFLVACTSMVGPIQSEQLSKIAIGVSTKDQVIEILGLPRDIRQSADSDGHMQEIWWYYDNPNSMQILSSSAISVGVVPVVIPSFKDTTDPSHQVSITLIFDDKGILSEVRDLSERLKGEERIK